MVLAKLTALGHTATLTLGNTKRIDILLSAKNGNMYRIEVKTAFHGPYKTKPFGENIEWHMGEKHEKIRDKNLYYCFVFCEGASLGNARFFVVPSRRVADYVKEEHRYYREDIPHRKILKKTDLRMFRIALAKGAHGVRAQDFEDRWDFFGG